jgi:hypothetical protein
MLMNTHAFKGEAEHAKRIIDWIANIGIEEDATRQRASDAGAELADAVYRFLEDPEAVGTDALRRAYGQFMGLHAGNFSAPKATA